MAAPHQAHRDRPAPGELDVTGQRRPQVRQDAPHTGALRIPDSPGLRNQPRRHPRLAPRQTHLALRSVQTHQTPLRRGRPRKAVTAHGSDQTHPWPSSAHHPGHHHRHRNKRP